MKKAGISLLIPRRMTHPQKFASGNTPKEEYNRLQSEHEQGNKNFNDAKAAEEDRQKWDGGSGKGLEDLNNIKDDLQKRISKP